MFISNFQINLEASGTFSAGAKIQYLCTLICGEVLLQLDTLFSDVVSTTSEHLRSIILVLGTYLFPVNVLPIQKHAMRRRMRKTSGIKVRRYASHIIELIN